MPRFPLRPLALLAALGACIRPNTGGQAVRMSELSWRACPSTMATEVVNGAQEAIRVYAGEANTGSPNPQPVGWMTTVRPGQSDVITTIQPNENYLWVTAVDRPTEPNGSLRKPIGFSQIRIRCVAR